MNEIDFSRLGPPPGTRMAVVGGCGGMGIVLVRAALDTGLRVAVIDMPVSIERHPPPPEALVLPIDATDETQVWQAIGRIASEWSGLDVLVTLIGLGVAPPRPIETFTVEEWDAFMAVNLRSVFLCAKHALPLLRGGTDPNIVTVSSLHAALAPKGFGPYGAAKAGLVNLTKGLALENAPLIRANSVAPAGTMTPFLGGGTGRGGEDADLSWFDPAHYAGLTPLGRMGRVDEAVAPILFLAGPAARFITGQVLHVSGGRIMP